MTKNTNILKFLFLLVSIVILAVIINVIYSQGSKTNNNDKKSNTSAENLKDYKLNINQSIFEGFSKNKLPYKIIAHSLKKTDEALYKINAINAKYYLNKGALNIKAASGILDENKNLISLEKDVNIEFDDVNFYTDEILLDLKTNDAVSDADILVLYKNSAIKSDSFNTKDSANKINFEGNVKSVFKLKDFE